MASSPRTTSISVAVILLHFFLLPVRQVIAQDYDYDYDKPEVPTAVESCNGIFLTYTFTSRLKEYPHLKNATAQAYAFKSSAAVLNTGKIDFPSWMMFIGFQHDEILVSISGAVIADGSDLPAFVGNGTVISGYPQMDLKNSIETAGDLNQISAKVEFVGTQFGVKSTGIPMPKTIKLINDGYKCPSPKTKKTQMYVCCVPDPKKKKKKKKVEKLRPLPYGDLKIKYDVMKSFTASYIAQVTLENNHHLGRLDNWNLTWEWTRGQFIKNMQGAYALKKDPSACIYGDAGKYYKDLDFTTVMSCEKRPILVDLPPERANDSQVGKIPYCCKNGTLLPPNMEPSKSKAVFQLEVYKIPPDMNRTALYPPQKWKINGYLNPQYVCGAPIKASSSEFPDTSGLMYKSYAIASWQVSCNITKRKEEQSRCCVSFSAFFNDSVIPCNTCACGCEERDTCNPKAPPLLLPAEALLIPFDNRTAKAKAWAKMKKHHMPKRLPCGDHCGVSINWHIFSDYSKGWTARITLFNWDEHIFKDWFAAVEMKSAFRGYEKTYSFNGTKLPKSNGTIFFQGLPGLNYLMGEVEGHTSKRRVIRVPGKQQSVISFKKNFTPSIDVSGGDGFPSKVYFNGEECAIPPVRPQLGAAVSRRQSVPFIVVFTTTMMFIIVILTLEKNDFENI